MTEKNVNAHLLLGDYAFTHDGKLTVNGIGWTFTGPDPIPSAIGLVIEVAWDQTNRKHTWSLALKDTDGNPVTDPAGNPLQFGGTFEAGRPPGHPAGTPINVCQALNFGPLPVQPGSRYVWELTIDGDEGDAWQVGFNVRPRLGPSRLAS